MKRLGQGDGRCWRWPGCKLPAAHLGRHVVRVAGRWIAVPSLTQAQRLGRIGTLALRASHNDNSRCGWPGIGWPE